METMMTNEELAATWEKRARDLRQQRDNEIRIGYTGPAPDTLLAMANQLEADAAELLRNTPNAGHDGCVRTETGGAARHHTHEGQTGWWLFPGQIDPQRRHHMAEQRYVKLTTYVPSITDQEHRSLRDAVDAASVSGETTVLLNSAGAPIAAIVPRGIQELGEAALLVSGG